MVYALASLFIPGLGHFLMGKKGWGAFFLVVGIFTFCLGGLVNIISAIFAWRHAAKLAADDR